MLYIKGFDKNLCCSGFQFEIGQTYDTGYTDDLELCSCTVFHFCKSIQQVHNYYNVSPDRNNRFCYVEALGQVVEDHNKCGSNKIKIVREIKGQELKQLLSLINGNTGLFNIGYYNNGDYNTGDCNTGYYNSGNYNAGDRNTGYYNSGNYNTGDYNSGYRNIGYRNSGDCNSGSYNSGNWNQCDRSTGLFNTQERTVTIFNKDSGLFFDEIRNTEWYGILVDRPFVLTEWIEYTEKEKKNSIIRQAIGGYLKKYSYKEACQNWWDSYSDKEKEYLAKNIPNFDIKIFKEITGVDYVLKESENLKNKEIIDDKNVKYAYDIYLDKLDNGNLVGDNGEMSFKTKEEALKDANDFIEEDLAKVYNSDPSEFRIVFYKVEEE